MGIKSCVVTMTTVLENLKVVLEGEKRKEAKEILYRVVLEGLYKYERGILK
jgi:uridine phosphorylase